VTEQRNSFLFLCGYRITCNVNNRMLCCICVWFLRGSLHPQEPHINIAHHPTNILEWGGVCTCGSNVLYYNTSFNHLKMLQLQHIKYFIHTYKL
jgi:hypothetical protein